MKHPEVQRSGEGVKNEIHRMATPNSFPKVRPVNPTSALDAYDQMTRIPAQSCQESPKTPENQLLVTLVPLEIERKRIMLKRLVSPENLGLKTVERTFQT